MTATLISSKMEDLVPIPMPLLLREAGHDKFTKEQITLMERDILQTLSFRLLGSPSIHH